MAKQALPGGRAARAGGAAKTVRLPRALLDAINAKKARTGIDPSFVIRRALELWVAGEFDPSRTDER